MILEPKSIAEHIECLARLTGAPESFVGQVRDLFSKKGISLNADATPYLRALDEAFKREETIRANAARIRGSLSRMHQDFRKIGKTYVQQLQRAGARSGENAGARSKKTQALAVPIPGSHRSYVTPQQSEDLPLVPGPEEPQ